MIVESGLTALCRKFNGNYLHDKVHGIVRFSDILEVYEAAKQQPSLTENQSMLIRKLVDLLESHHQIAGHNDPDACYVNGLLKKQTLEILSHARAALPADIKVKTKKQIWWNYE